MVGLFPKENICYPRLIRLTDARTQHGHGRIHVADADEQKTEQQRRILPRGDGRAQHRGANALQRQLQRERGARAVGGRDAGHPELAQHESDRLRGADRADRVEAEAKVLKRRGDGTKSRGRKITRGNVIRIE